MGVPGEYSHRLGTCDLQGSCLSKDLHLKLLARKRPAALFKDL